MDGHWPGAAAVILAQLALMALVSYILITQPSGACLLPVAIAFAIIACIGVLGETVWRRMQRDHKIIAASRDISGMISQLASCGRQVPIPGGRGQT
jgi:hypothetical protein